MELPRKPNFNMRMIIKSTSTPRCIPLLTKTMEHFDVDSVKKKKLDIQTKLLRSLCSIVNTKIKFGSNEKKIKKRKNIIVQKKNRTIKYDERM